MTNPYKEDLMEKPSWEGWAIVELFGHNQIAGMVSEETIGGGTFVRVDVPGTDGAEGFTKFYGAGAIYAVTPTTEELATLAAARLAVRPVSLWVLPDSRRQLPEQTIDGDDDDW